MPATQSSNLDPDSFMQGQQPAVTPEGYMATASTAPPDALQQALNYHTGHIAADIPLGIAQGAAKGLASTGYGLLDLANKVVPNPIQLNPDYRTSLTVPSGPGQGTGKFLEQAAEFALPSAGMSKLADGSNLLLRAAGQAAVGSGVAAAQSGGNPWAVGIGGTLGALGEGASALSAAMRAPKIPNLQNFSDAFAAVPTQKVAITRALDTLTKDGVQPGRDLPEMAQTIKGKLADLGQQYAALPADIPTREIDPNTVIGDLQKQLRQYQRGDVVSPENAQLARAIQGHIDTAEMLAAQNPNGKLTFDDLKYLRDSVNGRTNWAAPQADRNMFDSLGDIYRRNMDKIAPETTELNRKYAQYKQLDSVAQHNLELGRGITKSGLTTSLEAATNREIGSALGGFAGHMTGIPGGEFLGAVAGGALYPKLAKPAVEALQNAAQSGALQKLGASKMNVLLNALKRSDTQAILGLLGRGSTFQTLTASAPPAL